MPTQEELTTLYTGIVQRSGELARAYCLLKGVTLQQAVAQSGVSDVPQVVNFLDRGVPAPIGRDLERFFRMTELGDRLLELAPAIPDMPRISVFPSFYHWLAQQAVK